MRRRSPALLIRLNIRGLSDIFLFPFIKTPLAIRSLLKSTIHMCRTKGMEETTPGLGRSVAQGLTLPKTRCRAPKVLWTRSLVSLV